MKQFKYRKLISQGYVPYGPCMYIRKVRDDVYHIGCTVCLAKRLTHENVHTVVYQQTCSSIDEAIQLQDSKIDEYIQKGIKLDSYRKGYQKRPYYP